MPFAERNGTKIYYEARGRGRPLVLVEGLGYGLWMWRGQSPALEERFRLILVDNRGVGRSSPLPGPYSASEFARDILSVLDTERVEKAAVLGASMGGAIAQALAGIAPTRVDALVLSCTLPGGPASKNMPPETFAEVTRQVPNETEPHRLRRTMSVALTPGFSEEHPEVIDAIIADRLASPTDGTQWMYQAMSLQSFDATETDARLEVPVLLTTGTEDRVVPWTNSLYLYRLIPKASLVLFRGRNHLHLLERPTEFNDVVSRFLTGAPPEILPGSIEEVR
ncbi:MAG TPA: alpha/beta hydrolase [Thermoplasmata archaeon]|nr:alpha/beta hydrolase [Thermoplasmata archaeon]